MKLQTLWIFNYVYADVVALDLRGSVITMNKEVKS